MKGLPVASSGETAKATTTNAAVELIAADTTHSCNDLFLDNEGTVAGFFRIGSGDWCRLPAGMVLILENLRLSQVPKVEIKRVENGTDLANVYGFATGG